VPEIFKTQVATEMQCQILPDYGQMDLEIYQIMECFENLEIGSHVHWGKKKEIQEEKKCKGTSAIIHLKKQMQRVQ
jgi:hypothetical protein